MAKKIEKAVFTVLEALVVGVSLFMCGKGLIAPFFPPRKCCESRVCLFRCQGGSRKQFSPLWRSCEVGASLFICGKNLITPFYPRVGTVNHVYHCLSARED